MDWAIRLMETLGYPGIVLVVLLENLFPPIPSEVILPFAGFITTSGALTLPGVIAASTLGSVLGALLLYFAGAWFGRERIYRFVERYERYLTVSPEHVTRAEAWFERHGVVTVLLCRMVPIMRSIISIPAGLVRMNLLTFTVYTAIGALVWNTALAGIGALLGSSWHLVSQWVSYYQDLVIAIGVLAVLAFVVSRLRARRAR